MANRLLLKLALVLTSALAPGVSAGQRPDSATLLPLDPGSAERLASIEALQDAGPGLARAFTRQEYRNAKSDRMPYRLSTPTPLATGRTSPLVVFLHGSGGSGVDNDRQLRGAKTFGALVWALPGNQQRHRAFVLAPHSDVNWWCRAFRSKSPPKTAADIVCCPPDALGIGARLALEIVGRLVTALPVDRDRICVSDGSLDGRGRDLALDRAAPAVLRC